MGQIDMEGRDLLTDNLSVVTKVETNEFEPGEQSAPSESASRLPRPKYLKLFKANKARKTRHTSAEPVGQAAAGRPKIKMMKKFKDFFSTSSLKKTLNVLYKNKSRGKLSIKSVQRAKSCQSLGMHSRLADSCDEQLNNEASSDTKAYEGDEGSQGIDHVDPRHAFYTHESKNLVYQDEYIPGKEFSAEKPALAEYAEHGAFNEIYDENAIFNPEINKIYNDPHLIVSQDPIGPEHASLLAKENKMRFEMNEMNASEMTMNQIPNVSSIEKQHANTEQEEYSRSISTYPSGQTPHNDYYNHADCCQQKGFNQQCSSQFQLYNQMMTKNAFSEYGYSSRSETQAEPVGAASEINSASANPNWHYEQEKNITFVQNGFYSISTNNCFIGNHNAVESPYLPPNLKKMLPEQTQYCDYNAPGYHHQNATLAASQDAYYNSNSYFQPLVNNQNVVNGHRLSNDQVLLSYDLINNNRALLNNYDQSYAHGAPSVPLTPVVDDKGHLFAGSNGFKDLNNNAYGYGSNMICSNNLPASYDKHMNEDPKSHKKKHSDHKSKNHSKVKVPGSSGSIKSGLPMASYSNFAQNPTLKSMMSVQDASNSLVSKSHNQKNHQPKNAVRANKNNKMHGFSMSSSCSGMGSNGGHSSHSSKRKRKRVLNRLQRAEATMREKRRMLKLNKAFEELRKVLPISEFAKNKLSRAETLKSAIEYIDGMMAMLNGSVDGY